MAAVGDVIDALVATFSAGSTAAVYDGPPVVSTAPADFVLVGWSDDGESTIPLNQAWAGLGANARDETGSIPCAIVSQSGATNIKTHRDRALVILGELEAAIVADPTLGGAVHPGWLLVESGNLSQEQNKNGSRVSVNFSVSYRARI